MVTTRTGLFPIGFRCNCDWQNDLPAAITFAVEHGFAGLDVGTRHADKLETITAAGLTIGTVDVKWPWGPLMSPDPLRRRDAAQARAAYIRSAVEKGARLFFMCAFPEDDTRPRRENFKYAVDGYGQLCQAIEPLGAKIVLEGYPGSRPWFPTLACTPADCRALLYEVNSPALGLNFDPSHLVRVGIDPLRFIQEFAPHIYHVHAKDTLFISEALYEHGNLQEATFDPPHDFGGHHWRYTIPGHGCVPWLEMLDQLYVCGYRGMISIELEDEDFTGSEELEKRGFLASRDFLVNC